jgi:hypothetical protein
MSAIGTFRTSHFATGIALSLLLIAAYSRPFTGEISVRPDLLKQVIASEATVGKQPLAREVSSPGSASPSLLVVADTANLVSDLRVEGSLLQRLV